MQYEIQPQQAELFRDKIPHKPYCTDQLNFGIQPRIKSNALNKKYIQVNPPWLRSFIVFDIDRENAVLAWEDKGLPEPIWASMNTDNGHAHLAFALDAPVLLHDSCRQKPMRYLAAIESAMTAKLDADFGYSGLITKNPLHAHWRTLHSTNSGIYDLDYLSEFVDLKKHAPKNKPEQVGLGRNCDTFDFIRKEAYKIIKGFKSAGGQGIYVQWLNELYQMTLNHTGNEHANPLGHQESHHIAKSIAHWTWNKFDIEASDRRFRQTQSMRGKISGHKRALAAENKMATARLMSAQGFSQGAIALELGVTERTIRRWRKSGH